MSDPIIPPTSSLFWRNTSESSGADVDLSDYVTKDGVETLTNKTLDSPDIAEIKNGAHSITVPVKSGTMALNADLLEAKRIAEHADLNADDAIDRVEVLESGENLSFTNPTLNGNIQINATGLTTSSAYYSGDRYSIGYYSPPNSTTKTLLQIPAPGPGYSGVILATNNSQQWLENKVLYYPRILGTLKTMNSSYPYNDKYTFTFPNKSGTIALLSDITNAQSGGSVDLSDYVTRSELSDYATRSEVNGYATKTGTETLTNKTISGANYTFNSTTDYEIPYLQTYINSKEVLVPNVSGYITSLIASRGNQTLYSKSLKDCSLSDCKTDRFVVSGNYLDGTYCYLPTFGGNVITDQYWKRSNYTLGEMTNLHGLFDLIYPIGTVLFRTTTENNPGAVYTWQTWELIDSGYFIQTANSSIGSKGGNLNTSDVTLTSDQIPSHTHTFTGSTIVGEIGPVYGDMTSKKFAYGAFSLVANTGQGIQAMLRSYDVPKFDGSKAYLPHFHFESTPSGTISNTGGSGSHKHTINPPYIKLLCYKRTA